MSTLKETPTKALTNRLQRQPGGQVVLNNDNTWTATLKFITKTPVNPNLLPRRGWTGHPDYPRLLCSGYSIENKEGGVDEITVNYGGFPANTSTNPKFDPANPFGTSTSTSSRIEEVPIEQHPGFGSFSGKIIDDNDQFLGFAVNSPLRGVTHFIRVRLIHTVTRAVPIDASVDVASAGQFSGGFLCVGSSVTLEGGVKRIVEEWMSGPFPNIY